MTSPPGRSLNAFVNARLPRAGTVVGVVALVLVAGAAVAARVRPARTDALRTFAIDPSPDVVTVPQVPTVSPLPAVAPTAVPTLAPLPVVTVTPSRSPQPAPHAQTGHWAHTENGVTMDVTMTPSMPRAGELVTFTVRIDSDAHPDCCAAQILFGDNQGAGEEQARYCDAERARPPGGHAVFRFHHGYRRGGTYTPWISAMASCSDGALSFQMKPTMRVAGGPLLSNGPVLPWVMLDDSVPMDSSEAAAGQWFQGGVQDHDGYVWAWTWSWGDGTTTVVSRNPETCHWPKDGGWIEWQTGPRAAHRFPKPGTYTVTLTAVTAGCDGRDRQRVAASMSWTVADGN